MNGRVDHQDFGDTLDGLAGTQLLVPLASVAPASGLILTLNTGFEDLRERRPWCCHARVMFQGFRGVYQVMNESLAWLEHFVGAMPASYCKQGASGQRLLHVSIMRW